MEDLISIPRFWVVKRAHHGISDAVVGSNRLQNRVLRIRVVIFPIGEEPLKILDEEGSRPPNQDTASFAHHISLAQPTHTINARA